jgi:hypothetical protein
VVVSSPDPKLTVRLRRWLASAALPLAAVGVSRAWLAVLGTAIWALALPQDFARDFYYGLAPVRDGLAGALLGMWQRWDGINYQRVALFGYFNDQTSAFYPLFPLAARYLARFSPLDVLAAQLLISFGATVAAALLLYRIAQTLFDLDTAAWAVIFLMSFPAAFFLVAPYAESLQLALGLGAYYAALKRRWLAVLILGLLTGLTQPTAVFLMFALLVEAVRRESRSPWLRRGLAALASLGPGMGVALFLAYRAGRGFPAYQAVQHSIWGWEIHWPWQIFLALANPSKYLDQLGVPWINIGIALAVIGVTVWGWRRLPPALALFQAAQILFLLSSMRPAEPFACWGRHALFLFPTYLILAQEVTSAQPRRRLLTISLLAQIFLAAQYFAWRWVG